MKKTFKFILLLILMPCLVNAKDFSDAKNITNTYMKERFESDYSRYIINDTYLYGLDSSYKIFDSSSDGFKTGGLLNSVEFLMSKKNSSNESSWLYDLNGYWTMTKDGEKRNIINANGIDSLDESSDSHTRPTEYIKNGTRVTGKGTYKNPWVISKRVTVEIIVDKHDDYNDAHEKIEIEPITTTSPNPQTIEYSKNASFNLKVKSGYELNEKGTIDSCGGKIVNNVLTFENVMDNITCRVLYSLKNLKLTFDSNGGESINDVYTINYLGTYPKLPTPTRAGYEFLGWYTGKTSGIKVESNDEVLATADIVLYARWKSNIIGYDTISNSFMCANMSKGSEPYIFTYTGDCEVLDNGNNNWKVKYLTSGDLIFNANINTDMFIVGGGGYHQGSGGYASTFKDIKMESGVKKHIEIGVGGTSNTSSGKSYYDDESVYYADGGGSYRKSGSNAAGTGGSEQGAGADANQEFNDNYYSGGTYYTNSTPGNSYGLNQYSQEDKPWSGQTTCEFDEGTISGCYFGDEYAYSPGGGGCRTNIYNFPSGGSGPKGSGLKGKNSGAGGSCYEDGSSGVVIIRSKIPREIKINGKIVGTYTGDFNISNATSNWKIKFTSSGELKLYDNIDTDIFVVGGGGGNAGAGGYASTYLRQRLSKNNTYNIKVGKGGSAKSDGEESYLKNNKVNYYANGGGVGQKGIGGNNSGIINGKSQYYTTDRPWSGQSTCEFNEGIITTGCFDGYDAYAGGGTNKNVGTIGGGGASGKSGTLNTGGGGGTNAGGGTGIVIIRKMKVNDIKIGDKVIGSYSGKYNVEGDENNWKIKFLSSGELYLYNDENIDIFVVGGGGGNLGGGGYTNTYKDQSLIKNTKYYIKIGLGGTAYCKVNNYSGSSGEQSYLTGNKQDFVADGGSTSSSGYRNTGYGGASGGNGGGYYYWDVYFDGVTMHFPGYVDSGCSYGGNIKGCGKSQGKTTCEFDEGTTSSCFFGDEYAYAGGGSGGSVYVAGGGGTTGRGGDCSTGKAGTDNRGGGGGQGAAGGSGIVIIRNKR